MKKKGLFLCSENYDFNDSSVLAIGIAKKILSQVKTLNTDNSECGLVNLYITLKNPLLHLICIFFSRNMYINKIAEFDFATVDFVYIRRFIPLSLGFVSMLAYIKNINKDCKIIYEIPTYPYDSEHRGFKGNIILLIDKIFRQKLKYYIDYIVTYSQDDVIFGIKTIKIMNGIDCSAVSPIDVIKYRQETIRLIAVAQFAEWHGYDRLIKGLYEYYKKAPEKKVFIDFVGNGGVLQQYQKMVALYGLEEYVIFHGVLTGDFLSDVFNQADVAVCSLGCHRKGIDLSSELKSREYMARGLPMISSTKIDILPDDYPYIQYVPEDDSPIDINTVINFYNSLTRQENREAQIRNIRNFAETHFDMHITMQPVIGCILNISFA